MNCIIVDDDEMSRTLVRHFVERTPFLNLSGVYSDGTAAFHAIVQHPVDLVFLDVEMPEMTGIELIRSLEKKPYFILITSRKDYAFDAFENNVLDYLLKPISYPRFLRSAEKAIRIFNTKQKNIVEQESIFIKVDNGRMTKISVKEILWIEALADYIVINTATGKFTVHSTMKSMENKLPESKFFRVHRSFIVNLEKISEIEENTLSVNKHLIPIGRSYKNDLIRQLNLI